jgi:RNA-directed DNA polymerase
VISPLLANLYMNRLLKHWRLSGEGAKLRAQIVNYADDFVILARGTAREALAWTRMVVTKLGLRLNETKTRLCDARVERFDFLGYAFGPHWRRDNGRRYLGASPSKKSMQRIKDKIGGLLRPSEVGTWPEVCKRLNRLLAGWSAYFGYGSRLAAYRAIDDHVYDRVRKFLVRRQKIGDRGTRQIPAQKVFGELGVRRLRLRYRDYLAHAAP